MQTFYVKTSFSISGMSVVSNRTIQADNLINATEDIPAGVAGTAGGAGVMTMPTGHGFVNSDKVCVSWAGGVNYGGTVSDAGVNAITVSGGTGDTLPTAGAVVIGKQVELDIAVEGDNAKAIFIGGDIALTATLNDAGGIELVRNTNSNGAYEWDSGCGEINPIAGDTIIKAYAYNRGVTAGTINVVVGYDNV